MFPLIDTDALNTVDLLTSILPDVVRKTVVKDWICRHGGDGRYVRYDGMGPGSRSSCNKGLSNAEFADLQ